MSHRQIPPERAEVSVFRRESQTYRIDPSPTLPIESSKSEGAADRRARPADDDLPASRRPGAACRLLSAGALAVLAARPAAGPTLAFLQLLVGPANATLSGHFLLGILDPADELVTGQRRDVVPGIECGGVGDQRLAQVGGKLVHHATRHSRATHRANDSESEAPPSPEPAPAGVTRGCHRGDSRDCDAGAG